MSRKPASPAALLKVVNDALDLIDGELSTGRRPGGSAEALPSLYRQCLDLSAEIRGRENEPVRTVHHFACTGGTILCRYLAATPNARLLSELDPLSRLTRPHFSPSDLILQYRSSTRPHQQDVLSDIFLAGLSVIHRQAVQHGERLILRDHTHSHYCTGPALETRESFRRIVARRFPLRSVVTVRHPLDSFLALQVNDWMHFRPAGLDEYARRYMAFLDDYADVPIVSYEDFLEAPDEVLLRLCGILDLAPGGDLSALVPAVRLTGDSGRRGDVLKRRDRRPVPDAVAETRAQSADYHALCARLGYDP